MALAGTALLYTLPFLAVIFVIIVVHEWGHFWSRRLGIKVEAFAMGFRAGAVRLGRPLWHPLKLCRCRWAAM
jgi:membrane-associated protease RseP (regulator of RpoE activity)